MVAFVDHTIHKMEEGDKASVLLFIPKLKKVFFNLLITFCIQFLLPESYSRMADKYPNSEFSWSIISLILTENGGLLWIFVA